MLFNSVNFLVFFPVVFFIYATVPKRFRKYILLIASYYFYMSWNPGYAVLIGISTVTTWLAGILLDNTTCHPKKKISKYRRKFILIAGITVNLGILIYFKYFNFLCTNLYSLFDSLDISVSHRLYDIVLPVGISFYTFQAVSYVIDVYRADVSAEKNLLSYALFVSFFPQLVAGPIERSGHLLEQIQNLPEVKLFCYERITFGLKIMLYGYFLKMVIADRIATYVNIVFTDYMLYNSSILFTASVLFSIQIYCDFNSYSLIAIGCARILGINLMENFDAPYFSKSVSEFWRRWHISLNTWFRDYVYIPLGGNRCSGLRHMLNVMAVFLLSGLWHGADWSFLVWGGNGLYQVIGKLFKPARRYMNTVLKTRTESFSYKLMQTIITFLLVDFAWIFFRADNVQDAVSYILRMITRFDPWVLAGQNVLCSLVPAGVPLMELKIALSGILFICLVDAMKYYMKRDLHELLSLQCIWFRWGIYIFLCVMILVYGVYGDSFQSVDFIYFQF